MSRISDCSGCDSKAATKVRVCLHPDLQARTGRSRIRCVRATAITRDHKSTREKPGKIGRPGKHSPTCATGRRRLRRGGLHWENSSMTDLPPVSIPDPIRALRASPSAAWLDGAQRRGARQLRPAGVPRLSPGPAGGRPVTIAAALSCTNLSRNTSMLWMQQRRRYPSSSPLPRPLQFELGTVVRDSRGSGRPSVVIRSPAGVRQRPASQGWVRGWDMPLTSVETR